jgi:hypothetical protein
VNPATDIPLLLLVLGISITVFDPAGRRWPLPAALALAVSVGVVLLVVTGRLLMEARL